MLTLTAPASAWTPLSANENLNEYAGSAFQLNDSRLCVFFENVKSFETQPETTSLLASCQDKNFKFAPAQAWSPKFAQPMLTVGNPRPLKIASQWWIYFNAWDGQRGHWGRFPFAENDFQPTVEWLESPEDLQGQYRPWIFPVIDPLGAILLTYERRASLSPSIGELRFSQSQDGKSFKASQKVGEKSQMIRAAFFKSGIWAFTYQVGHTAQMMDYLIFSSNQGKTFTAPLAVTSQKNVHDPFLLQRQDGDLDVYYVVWQNGEGFVLFRRAVTAQGLLGPEERLSPPRYAVDKPHALRLQDGSVFITTGKINASETKIDTDLYFTILTGDAPVLWNQK